MKRFTTKPFDLPRQMRSSAQKEQQQRAFHIFRLRGLYALAHIMRPNRRRLVLILIDQELAQIGAQPQGERDALREVWNDVGDEIKFEEIPF